ncbi:putative dehydrogenase [Aureimonas pseudogalii]|uniref:Putative dehydrogenase n=1 Tax=Aureimonas pseudogalii TaxID=1744844 RepID=A0A7W6H8K6_9HYPH|nr:putative dehydrogenase [Aureimonas pseudogalii]
MAEPFANAAQLVAEAYGAEPMTDAMAAIARPDVDAVVIGTPTDTHVGLMMRAVELGNLTTPIGRFGGVLSSLGTHIAG